MAWVVDFKYLEIILDANFEVQITLLLIIQLGILDHQARILK